MTEDFFFPPQELMLRIPVHEADGMPCSPPNWLKGHIAYLFGLGLWARSKRILELGTGYYPEQSEAMAAFLPIIASTDGHLVTIDIEDCVYAKNKVASLGMSDRVTFIKGDDCVVDVEGPFDLIFLDSSKEASHAKKELARFGPMLLPGGYLVSHDTQVDHYPGYRDTVLAWAEENGWPWKEYIHSCGLFVVRRPDE